MASLSPFQRSIYKFYSLFMHIYFTCFVIALYVGIVPIWQTDSVEVLQAISVIILCTLILVKAAICQRKKVTEMISEIEDHEKEIDTWNDDIIDIYTKNARYNTFLSLFLFTASTLCGITLITTKFLGKIDMMTTRVVKEVSRWTNRNKEFKLLEYLYFAVYEKQLKKAKLGLLNESLVEKPLPYVIWRPVDEKTNYWEAFCLDTLSASIGCTFNSITQLIFLSLLTYISGQLQILQFNFRNFGRSCANSNGRNEKLKLLRKLITKHLDIISFVANLDENMKYLLLLEFTINSFQITGIVYELLMSEPNLMLIFQLTYLSCMVLQIFMLAWHANEVTIQSTQVAHAVFDCEWYDLPKTIKEMLVFIILRSQKPLTISVGPFFILTNATAVTSMKAAYSYLAVLTNSRG
ncbi:odorant receptor 94a-like [Diorhabda sublineata]|uniref:odorant receptor 94a-like n=1 Tax=Diorhabda sublineata TaxID=1163346 RepID=UPI0024E1388C|nr:odorant receptor 94a-like [Diorhabda sublineata]